MVLLKDGAPAHHANNTLSFLRGKFGNRLIALGTRDNPVDVPWPPHSPELNPCDYWLWAYVEMRVKKRTPNNRDELISLVDEELDNLSRNMVRNAVANIRRRCDLCIEENGGHFQHLMSRK